MAYFLLMPPEPKGSQWEASEYDDILGVYADDEKEARELCAEAFPAGGEEGNPWLDPTRSICRQARMLGPAPQGYKGVHFFSRERRSK
jgi:hypothetical protein